MNRFEEKPLSIREARALLDEIVELARKQKVARARVLMQLSEWISRGGPGLIQDPHKLDAIETFFEALHDFIVEVHEP